MPFDHEFIAPVLLTKGGMTPHKLPLPNEIGDPLREARVKRIIGTLDGHPFRLALHRSHDGFSFIALSRDRMRTLDLEAGALVEVALRPDPDPDHVDLGDVLEAALQAAPDALEVWDTLTPGTRRAYAYTVTSAKRADTQESRADDLVRRLRDGTHAALRRRW
ncbi:YdeI/OmpD-associated family protein [Rubrivirga sp.]|uniref:YdeI/OmpD-associated family protein n=1 Tax=Rubrivirga sp. TaxID=1885344 RepID=UPI003C77E8DA